METTVTESSQTILRQKNIYDCLRISVADKDPDLLKSGTFYRSEFNPDI